MGGRICTLGMEGMELMESSWIHVQLHASSLANQFGLIQL